MDREKWQAEVRKRVVASREWLRSVGPGMAYGALATCTLLPLVSAAQQNDFAAIGTLYQIVGGVGGNLLSQQLATWFGKNDAEVAELLGTKAAQDPAWRDAFDQLLQELQTPKLAQAVLSEADWDRLQGLLAADVKQLGSKLNLQIEGDVHGDLISANLETGVSKAVIGKGNTQQNIDKIDKYVEREENIYYGTDAPDPAKVAEQQHARYFGRLRTHCQAIPLSAMGGEATAGDEVTLDDLYTSLDTTTRIPLTEAEKEAREKDAFGRVTEDKPLTAQEAAQQNKRLVLLGHPGGGKSTFVRQWIVKAISHYERATTSAQAESPRLFPMLTLLRDLAPNLQQLDLQTLSPSQRAGKLVETLQAQWQVDLKRFGGESCQALFQAALQEGQVLLVFDGLDEMPANVRQLVREALVALAREYPTIAQMIVTCRIRSYVADAQLPGFQAYTLANFDEEKIQHFAEAWYNAQQAHGRLSSQEKEEKIQDLQRAALQPQLRSMAENPMLLTTMAIIHQKHRLPDQRVQLYKEAVDILLYRWQQERRIALSPALASFLRGNRVRRVLEQLAYAAHRPQRQQAAQVEDQSADLTRAEVIALLDEAMQGAMGLAGELLDYVDVQAGLLLGRGGDETSGRPALYAFAHRTFQEYLAGCWLLFGREMKRNYWLHAAEGDYWQLAAQLGAEELFYNRQNETALLDLMYELSPTTQQRNEQGWRATLWSGQMALLPERQSIEQDTLSTGGTAYLQRLIKRLETILTRSHLPALERADAGRVLGRLGDPRKEVTTTEQMHFCYIPAGLFRMGSDPAVDELANKNEQPQHTFDIPRGYWLGRYPVTNAQYQHFVDAGGYANEWYWREAIAVGYWADGAFKARFDSEPRRGPVPYSAPFNLPNHPVVGVSWYEALAYTCWLTEQLPAGWQARLPSEAEWEKAARGGLQIPQQPVGEPLVKAIEMVTPEPTLSDNPLPVRRYAWGDTIDPERLNYAATNIGSSSTVGAFPAGASPYGIEELNGNVWEWTRTHWIENYQDYASAVQEVPTGDAMRLLSGGSYNYFDYGVRATIRFRHYPYNRYDDFGFRCLLSPFTSER